MAAFAARPKDASRPERGTDTLSGTSAEESDDEKSHAAARTGHQHGSGAADAIARRRVSGYRSLSTWTRKAGDVGTDDPADAIFEARSQLQRLISRVRQAAPQSAREAVIQALAQGLRALPIPLVGDFLANLVADTLKPENQGPGLEDLLSRLTDMAESDSQFEDGLASLGKDMNELRDDLRAIRETQVGTAFTFTRVNSLDRWPVFDNQISGLLINRGGGLVVLNEVYIDVEGYEPITEIDLTVPAAPLETIRLKVELAPDRDVYSLFAINHEEPHQFTQGLGAERLEINLSSRHNARYFFRLRLAYYDDATEQDREQTWPTEDKPAVMLPLRAPLDGDADANSSTDRPSSTTPKRG